MNKTTIKNQPLFDLHIEYKEKAAIKEKEYRDLEGRFALAFGYLPIQIQDDTFFFLADRQQEACRAFWGNLRVTTARKEMLTARSLSEAYFNAHVDRSSKSL